MGAFYLAGSELSIVWLETHSLTFRRLQSAQARLRPGFAAVLFGGALRDFRGCSSGSATAIMSSLLSVVASSEPSAASVGVAVRLGSVPAVDSSATLLEGGRESSPSRASARARLFDRAVAASSDTSSTVAAETSGGVLAEPASECSASTPESVLD